MKCETKLADRYKRILRKSGIQVPSKMLDYSGIKYEESVGDYYITKSGKRVRLQGFVW